MKETKKEEQFYEQAYNWILTHGPDLILGVVVLIVGLWVIRLLSKWMHAGMHRREVDPSLKPFLMSLAAAALRVLLFLFVLDIIGVQMTIFAALIGAIGVAAGLALSGTLQNFASGVLILLLKPFRVGDNIIAQGQEGTVTSIQIFYTIVTTFDNRTVVVPNSKLSNEVIINISKEGTRRLDIEIKFGYATDFERVKEVVTRIADRVEKVNDTPEPRIGVATLQPDGFILVINVWLPSHGFQDAKLQFQHALMNELKNAELLKIG
jgi:small conductance mechanosensitive channel